MIRILAKSIAVASLVALLYGQDAPRAPEKDEPGRWYGWTPPERIQDNLGSHLATWYAKGRCKDGSRFTGRGFTCASTVFSRGSRLILESGGKSLEVRVNDYGPQRAGFTLDVSARVADYFGFRRRGWARLNVSRWERFRRD